MDLPNLRKKKKKKIQRDSNLRPFGSQVATLLTVLCTLTILRNAKLYKRENLSN